MIHSLTDFIGEAEFVSFYLFNSIQFDLNNHNPLFDCIGEADRDPKKRNNKAGAVEKMLQVRGGYIADWCLRRLGLPVCRKTDKLRAASKEVSLFVGLPKIAG
nr:hypothetical protein [Tanacetum cinerariifolium]